MNVKKIVSIAALIILVIMASFGVILIIFKVVDNPAKVYAAGVSLYLKDDNTSIIEEILDENLPVHYTIQKIDRIRHYAVIPSSEFNSLKEILKDNEGIGIIAVKQEEGDTYVFISHLDDTHPNTNELQEHLNKYSLEVKEVDRIYVRFEKDIHYGGIAHTLDLLKKENNVIRAYPDLLEGKNN